MMRKKLSYLALVLFGFVTLSFLYWGHVQATGQPENNVQLTQELPDQSNSDVREETEDWGMNEDFSIILEGTVVEVSADEVLFVAQLNLPTEMLERTFDDWLMSDQLNDVYRLSGVGNDVTVGTEIRIWIAITTRSIPPLAPVLSYEIIN